MDEHGLPIVGAGVDYTKVYSRLASLGHMINDWCVKICCLSMFSLQKAIPVINK